MGTTEILAKFVVGTKYENVPQEAIKIAKELCLDCMGCALAGSKDPIAEIIVKYIKEIGGNHDASVIGTPIKTSTPNAAFANGTFAHVLDLDDFAYFGHPSVTILPVLLALGEKLEISGKQFLEAHLVGFEVYGRLGNSTPALYSRGWHPTAIFGTMGAAAAAAKLLKLDVGQVKIAFGITASETSGLKTNIGTMTKSFHAGNASKNGIVAALLAKEGFTANKEIIEDPLGFCHTYFGDGNFDLESVSKNLGSAYRIITSGPRIKKYPCCGVNNLAIDTMLQISEQHELSYEEVESIEVDINNYIAQVCIYSQPKTGYEGKFSLEYNLVVPLFDKNIGLKTYTDDAVLDPQKQEALKKVKKIFHPEWPSARFDEQGMPITVRLKDGRKYTHPVDRAKKRPKISLTREELLVKYTDCAKLVLPPEKIEQSVELILNLERLQNIKKLTTLFRTE